MGKKMRKICAFMVCIVGFSKTTLHAYQKFCYAAYQYPEESATSKPTDHYVHHHIPFRSKNTYSFQGKHKKSPVHEGVTRCFVHLKRKDRSKLRTQLLKFSPQTRITDDLIYSMRWVTRGKDQVVSWVLEDFKHKKADITIGEVVSELGLLPGYNG
ncbi:MAG TPA: hypothetical protein VFF04_02430 [Candidatus Babeliales bacterium]|nr:hypothetical protein [Candidatus Babeliales bacterium]